MKEFIEKLIGRLEEKPVPSIGVGKDYIINGNAIPKKRVVEIVNELAEEYSKDKDWETTRRFLDEKYFSKIRELSEKYNHPCEDIPIDFVWVFGLIEKIEGQLAEEYKHCTLCYLQSPCEYQNENAMLQNELLADKNGWIPCIDKYPEDNRTVLTVDSEGNMEVLDYDTKWGNCFCKYDGAMKVFNIIAWQPLPEPYKTEG